MVVYQKGVDQRVMCDKRFVFKIKSSERETSWDGPEVSGNGNGHPCKSIFQNGRKRYIFQREELVLSIFN